jgi:hypothetical protein
MKTKSNTLNVRSRVVAPYTKVFVDRKKQNNKNACRKKVGV